MINRLLSFFLIMIWPFLSIANPWLPQIGGWKYHFNYSQYHIPSTIKFYERDLYFLFEKAKNIKYQALSQENNNYQILIDNRKAYILKYNQGKLDYLKSSFIKQGIDTFTILAKLQEAKDNLFAQDQDMQIYYKRRDNIAMEIQNHIKNINDLQKHLILSYHKLSVKTGIEYGLNNDISYGMNIGRTKGVDKYTTNHIRDEAEIFIKTKLYDKKGYVFTIQPKIITGPIGGVDFTAMLGKSRLMEHKLFDNSIRIFGYTSFGITYYLGNNPLLKKKIHAEITSGIKYNDRTIIMNQESEDFNTNLGKIYKRVLRSQFTIAQDLNFANIEPRNKAYLTLSYFSIDSIKSRRRLSSGYSVGLWLEL